LPELRRPLRTLIVGFGQVAGGYDEDPLARATYRYTCHAAVLQSHPAFQISGVVDVDKKAQQRAGVWGIQNIFSTVEDACKNIEFDVAVICTPPSVRETVVADLPSLAGIVLEKPLGVSYKAAQKTLDTCQTKTPLVQVNLWRRADPVFRTLAEGKLTELIGDVQGGVGLYCKGLRNNGIHMIDFVRMLVGEIQNVEVAKGVSEGIRWSEHDDPTFPFSVFLNSGEVIHFVAIDDKHYRANGLDLWGTRGRLSILYDSRRILYFPKVPHESLSGEFEIASDKPEIIPGGAGQALYDLYDNLAGSIMETTTLFAPGHDAVRNEYFVESLLDKLASRI
jgi:predicted dehydrogenase